MQNLHEYCAFLGGWAADPFFSLEKPRFSPGWKRMGYTDENGGITISLTGTNKKDYELPFNSHLRTSADRGR